VTSSHTLKGGASNGKTDGTQDLPNVVPDSTTELAFRKEGRGSMSTGVFPVSPTVSLI